MTAARELSARFELQRKARARFPGEKLYPCSGRTWHQCYIRRDGVLELNFNTPDGNTHVVREEP